MAVPFNMPEDQNEVEVLLIQLQTLLNRLQVAVRRNQQLSQQQQPTTSFSPSVPSTSRVRNSSTSRVRNHDISPQSVESMAPSSVTQSILPDLLTNLSWLAGSASGTSSSSSPLTAISVRSPRRRITSESSDSDETKISITAIVKHDYYAQDWNKIDCVDGEGSKTIPADGLFSKVMPASVSSCSLMTAMICFVGWHIFRAR